MHKSLSKRILIAVLSAAMIVATPVAMINYNQVEAYASDVNYSAILRDNDDGKVKIKVELSSGVKYGQKSASVNYGADDLKAALKVMLNGQVKEGIISGVAISGGNRNLDIILDESKAPKSYEQGKVTVALSYDPQSSPILVENSTPNNPIAAFNVTMDAFNIEPKGSAKTISGGTLSGNNIILSFDNGTEIVYRGSDPIGNLKTDFTIIGINAQVTDVNIQDNNKIVLTLNKLITKPQITSPVKINYANNSSSIFIKDKDEYLQSKDDIVIDTTNASKSNYPGFTLTADGAEGTAKTNKITITFDNAPDSVLTAANIQTTGEGIDFGAVSKISDKVYEIAVSNVTKAGAKAKVSLIGTDAYNEGASKEIAVHKAYSNEEKAKAKLLKTIEKAEGLLKNTKNAEKAAEVAKGERFAPANAHTDLKNAVATAKGKMTSTVLAELSDANTALEAAVNTFNGAVKVGTKETAGAGSGVIAPISTNKTETTDTKKNDKTADTKDKKSSDTKQDDVIDGKVKNAKLTSTAKVSGNKATIKVSDKALKRAIEDANGKLTVNSNTKKATNVEVALSKTNLSNIAKSDVTKVDLKSSLGTLSISKTMIDKLAKEAKGDVVVALVKGNEGYEVKLSSSGKAVKADKKISVSVNAEKGQKVYTVDKSGKQSQKPIKSKYDAKTKTLKISINSNTKFIIK